MWLVDVALCSNFHVHFRNMRPGYRRPGRSAILPPQKVVRCLMPLPYYYYCCCFYHYSLLDYLKSSDLSFNCFRQQLKTFLFGKYWHQSQNYFSALETLLMRSTATNAWYLLTLLTFAIITTILPPPPDCLLRSSLRHCVIIVQIVHGRIMEVTVLWKGKWGMAKKWLAGWTTVRTKMSNLTSNWCQHQMGMRLWDERDWSARRPCSDFMDMLLTSPYKLSYHYETDYLRRCSLLNDTNLRQTGTLQTQLKEQFLMISGFQPTWPAANTWKFLGQLARPQ